MDRHRVVIIGAGFGGLAAAKELAGTDLDVTIVDQHNYHGFSPLLYQVATAGLAPDDIAQNVRGVFQRDANVDVRQSRVTGVDFDSRHVLLEEGPPLPYDFLILSAGSVSSDFGIPGVAEHAIPLKTVANAIAVRTTVLERFEEANSNPARLDDGTLTVVVAGGGPTGVELAGAMAELFTKVLARDFKTLDVGRSRVVLVELSDHLLHGFHADSQEEARRELRMRGVDVRLGVGISSVEADKVTLADGEVIPTQLVVWAAGVKANPLGEALDVELDRSGRIPVADDLSLPDHPEVFVVGDIAASRDRRNAVLPQLAPVAMQGARHAARSIVRDTEGKERRRFRYVDKGMMATIGRRSAVAEIPGGIHFGGTLGWLSWLGLHLVYLIGFRSRVLVLVNWAWMYLRWDRGNRVIVHESE
ncbi:MAG: NAD(P)/FAD-dependent oxidoreductase [Acidimicrobiia bacterium]